MNNHMRSLPKIFWWAAGSLVLMVVGAFGPWATVADLTIHGTDGGRDGWVVVGAAGIAALCLLLYIRSRRGWLLVFRSWRAWRVLRPPATTSATSPVSRPEMSCSTLS